MTRKQFILSHGATCKNWQNSWSFVNHKERFVIFGEWQNRQPGLIFSGDWRSKRHTGRANPGFKESRENIRLVEEEGYRLFVYPMYAKHAKADKPEIHRFEKRLLKRKLESREGRNWYAIGDSFTSAASRCTKDYLSYWTPETFRQERKPIILNHAASEQYSRLNKGDTVWIVTMKEKQLLLIGKIHVDAITNKDEAARRLKTKDLWDAKYHVFPALGDDTKSYNINISKYANKLRFNSDKDRLVMNDGQVNPQQLQSMRQLTTKTALLLRSLLGDSSNTTPDCGRFDNLTADDFPDELAPEKLYVEGAKKRVLVNAYERDSRARSICLQHYGYDCVVCSFSFESVYGLRGKDYIHVHHLKPISLTDRQYKLNPVKDLRPVCPNCHAMLHRGKQLLSIAELQRCLQRGDLK